MSPMPAFPGTRKNPTHPVIATAPHIHKVSLWTPLVKNQLKLRSKGSEHSFNASVKSLCENFLILGCWRREGNLLPIAAAQYTILSWDSRAGPDNLFVFCSPHVQANMHACATSTPPLLSWGFQKILRCTVCLPTTSPNLLISLLCPLSSTTWIERARLVTSVASAWQNHTQQVGHATSPHQLTWTVFFPTTKIRC